MKNLLTVLFCLPYLLQAQTYFIKSGNYTSQPEKITELKQGEKYLLADIATASIMAEITGPVTFALTGPTTRNQRETVAPFTLFGDNVSQKQISPGNWKEGDYKLTINGTSYTFSIVLVLPKPKNPTLYWSVGNILTDSLPDAPLTGLFTITYDGKSVFAPWGLPTPVDTIIIITPIDTVVTPIDSIVTPDPVDTLPTTPGLLVFDAAKHKFLAPDGNYYPDVRRAGVEWDRLDTAKWVKFRVPAGSSDAQIRQLLTQASAAQPGGVLLFDRGTFNISSQFYLQAQSNIIFRGVDRRQTVLNFTNGLSNDQSYFQTKETDSGARLKPTRTTPAFSNRVYLSASDMTQWRANLQPGRFVVCYAEVPTYWQGKYAIWEKGRPQTAVRNWNRQTLEIAEYNQAGGYIELTDYFPVDMEIGVANFTVQPITPSTGIGVENLTIRCLKLSGVPYAQVISYYRAFNVWADNLYIYDPIGYACDFKESSHGQFSNTYVSPMQEIEKGAFGYGGLTGGANIMIDSVRWDHPRHGPVTNGGVSGSVFRRLAFYGTDWQVSHDSWTFNTLFEEVLQEKKWEPGTGQIRYEPTTVKFGVNSSNVIHIGGPMDCAFYRTVSRNTTNQYGGRMIMVGMGTSGTVVSHSTFEGSLDENYAITSMIQVWDNTGEEPITFSDCKFILDRSKRPRQKFEPYLVDILPGTAYNQGGNWPTFQSAFRTYQGSANGEYIPSNYTDTPPVLSNAKIVLKNIEMCEISPDRVYTSFGGAKPTLIGYIRATPDKDNSIPAGIPGIPSIYEAQKKY